MTDGGTQIAEVLKARGVRHLFALCGGHISPILVGAKHLGIEVVDVRDEASAVFAADAVARMTGIPGVAAVTAGPGVTNAVTAVKNAQMAQSPVVLFGGATATVLRGRGSLQDIDQLSLLRPITKWATRITTLAQLAPAVDRAFGIARSDVPGPVFLEVPVDLLYAETVVREWYRKQSGGKGLAAKALSMYLEWHLKRQFRAPRGNPERAASDRTTTGDGTDHSAKARRVAGHLGAAERPIIVVGSQTLANVGDPRPIVEALRTIGVPTYLAGSARGLLGPDDPIQFRHGRSKALREADVVVVCGFPFDFRLDYGRSIHRKATLVSVNLSAAELKQNRRPTLAYRAHAGAFLEALAATTEPRPSKKWTEWFDRLRARESARDREIAEQAAATGERVNPVDFLSRLEGHLEDDAILVVDGGDFVATASYILRPRAPLAWLDPGVFGTLGVGGGFALGAGVCHRDKQVWLIYGDGSCAYSLAEFDTFVRHGLAPIAIVGNDASWAQIAREQVEVLKDDVGTVLRRTDYHRAAEGYGGAGLLIERRDQIDPVLTEAKAIARSGRPVCVNVHLDRTTFRKGSISI